MNFHVRGFPGHNIARKHGDERALRLVRVQILYDGLAAGQRSKIGRALVQFAQAVDAARVQRGHALRRKPAHQLRPRVVAALDGFQHLAPGVAGSALVLVVVEHGAAQAPAVRENLQLVVRNVPAAARVHRNERVAAIQQEEPHDLARIAERAHPRPVHKHLGQLVQVLRAALFQQLHVDNLAQPPNDGQRGARFRDVRRNCQVLLQPDVAAVRAVGGVNDAPLRPVQMTRSSHLGAGIHRQVRFAQVRYERVVRQAVQVLHDALHLRPLRRADGALVLLGLVVRLDRGRPLAFERLLEPRLNQALAEDLVVVVGGDGLHDLRPHELVAVATVLDLLVQLQPHVVHVRVVIRAKQVEHERARHLHALVFEAVAVRGALHVCCHEQQLVDHVPQKIRLGPEIQFADLRQEVVHENVLHLRHRFFLGEGGNELEGGGLREDLARVVHARNEGVHHGGVGFQIEQAPLHDVAVADDAQRAHDDEQRHRFPHVRNVHHDLVIGVVGVGRHHLDRHFALGLGRILRHGANLGAVAVDRVGIVRVGADVDHVVGELLLRHDALLLAVHDEVAAVVVAALAGVEPRFRRHAVQDAGVGLQHDGEPAQAELLQLQALVQHRLLHGVIHAIHHVHVAVDGHAVGHVAQARLVRIHEVGPGLFCSRGSSSSISSSSSSSSSSSRGSSSAGGHVVVNDGLAK